MAERRATRHHVCLTSGSGAVSTSRTTSSTRSESRSRTTSTTTGTRTGTRSSSRNRDVNGSGATTTSSSSTTVSSGSSTSSTRSGSTLAASTSTSIDASALPPLQRNKNTTVLYSQSMRYRNCGHSEPCDCAEIEENTFFFVIPPDLTEDTVSSSIKLAHQQCGARGFSNLTWIKDREVQSLQFDKGNIFVFDKFEGPGFKDLEAQLAKEQNFMIIGPNVLNYMFQRNVLEYFKCTQYPIRSLAMKDLTVSSTAVKNPEDKKELVTLVHEMGGVFDSKYTSRLTHLVAGSVLTDKAVTARKKKLPIMKPDWVRAVWDLSLSEIVHATDEQFITFEAGMFFNLNVSFSQISKQQKQRLERAIEKNGGTCSPELNRKTTNLVILPKPEGEKYRHAVSWSILCVRPDWVTDSCEVGYALPTKNYILNQTASDNPLTSTLLATGSNLVPSEMNLTSCSLMPMSTPNGSVINASNYSESNSIVYKRAKLPEYTQGMEEFQAAQLEEQIPQPMDNGEGDERQGRSDSSGGTIGTGKRSRSESGSRSGTSGERPHDATTEGVEVEPNFMEENDATPEPIRSVFQGRKFLLFFEDDAETYERIQDMILSVGGIIVSKDEQFHFIITTPIHSNPFILDYSHYTEYWLIDCDEVNSLIPPPKFYHIPVLEAPETKGLLTGVVMAVSSYSGCERGYTVDLASYMGATIQDVFSKKNKGPILASTHLVCNTMENQKAEAAIRWRIPVVTCNWILKCYSKRTKLDTSKFQPKYRQESSESDESETEIQDPDAAACITDHDEGQGATLTNAKNEHQDDGFAFGFHTNTEDHFDGPGAVNGYGVAGNSGAEQLENAGARSRDPSLTRVEINNQSGRKSTGNNTSLGHEVNIQAAVLKTPQHPRVTAIGSVAKKLSTGSSDSPVGGTQESERNRTVTESPPYQYIYPTWDEMLDEAAARPPIRSNFPPMPSPETPKFHREWLRYIQKSWLNMKSPVDENQGTGEGGSGQGQRGQVLQQPRNRALSRNSSSTALGNGNEKNGNTGSNPCPSKRVKRVLGMEM